MKIPAAILLLITVLLFSCKVDSGADHLDAVGIPTDSTIEKDANLYDLRVKPWADFPNTPYINYLGIKKPGC
jgi:hypothetical protein